MAVLRKETATLRKENKHLQRETEIIRKRLLEFETAPMITPVAGKAGERISPFLL